MRSSGSRFDPALPRPRDDDPVSKGERRCEIIYPVKYYSREGFVEYKIEIGDENLEEIIREYPERHVDFDFDEVEVVNNRPMNILLYAKCRMSEIRRPGSTRRRAGSRGEPAWGRGQSHG
jgi:hypothetical protein